MIREPPADVRVPGRRGRADRERRSRSKDPSTIATAIRIGKPASWDMAVTAAADSRRGASGRSPTTRSSPRYRPRRAGGAVRRARLGGERRRPAEARGRRNARRRLDDRLRPHGPRAEGPRVGHHRRRAPADRAGGRTGGRRRARALGIARMRLTARVPATAANLGPGFDCFGLALDLCNEVTIDTDADPGVSWEGEGADELPTDGSRPRVAGDRRRGLTQRRVPRRMPRSRRSRLHGVNRIPLGARPRFLLGGGRRRNGARGRAPRIGRLGGRPVLDVRVRRTSWRATRTTPRPPSTVPSRSSPTASSGASTSTPGSGPAGPDPRAVAPRDRDARRALPPTVPLADAVFNIAHGALAVTALASGDLDLLLVALHDRIHETIRSVPRSGGPGDDGSPASRAGPGLRLGLRTGAAGVRPRRAGRSPTPGEGWRVLRVPVRATGRRDPRGLKPRVTSDDV